MSPRSLAIYRLRAEDIAGSSDNLFKINFVRKICVYNTTLYLNSIE